MSRDHLFYGVLLLLLLLPWLQRRGCCSLANAPAPVATAARLLLPWLMLLLLLLPWLQRRGCCSLANAPAAAAPVATAARLLLHGYCSCCSRGYWGAAIAPVAPGPVAAPPVAAAPVDHAPFRLLPQLLLQWRLLPWLIHPQELLCDNFSQGGVCGVFRGCFSLGCFSCGCFSS